MMSTRLNLPALAGFCLAACTGASTDPAVVGGGSTTEASVPTTDASASEAEPTATTSGGADETPADGGSTTANDDESSTSGGPEPEVCFDGVPSRPAPLAELPSCPGPHVDDIAALPSREWLNLGQPEADPEFDRARGRSWTARMPAAEAIGGAFLYGEGIHGWWDEDTGYFMDDLWFYDLLAHRWICLYPGTRVPDPPALSLNADGFIADEDGVFVPVATAIHGWSLVTYDSDRRAFMSPTSSRGSYYAGALQPWLAELADDPARNTTHRSPWTYSVDSGAFDRKATASPTRPAAVSVYLSGQNRMFAWSNQGGYPGRASFYDTVDNDWSYVDAEGPAVPYGWDAHGVHDPVRNRVYLYGSPLSNSLEHGDNALWIYDLDHDTWSDPQPRGVRPPVGIATHGSVLHYDSSHDTLLLFLYRAPEGFEKAIYEYSPEDNAWEIVGEIPTTVGERIGWESGENASAFYNAELDVHIFFLARDSGKDPGTIWVFRS